MNLSQSVMAESSKADVRYSAPDRYVEAVMKHKKRLDLSTPPPRLRGDPGDCRRRRQGAGEDDARAEPAAR
jgi:hypothetical protein